MNGDKRFRRFLLSMMSIHMRHLLKLFTICSKQKKIKSCPCLLILLGIMMLHLLGHTTDLGWHLVPSTICWKLTAKGIILTLLNSILESLKRQLLSLLALRWLRNSEKVVFSWWETILERIFKEQIQLIGDLSWLKLGSIMVPKMIPRPCHNGG